MDLLQRLLKKLPVLVFKAASNLIHGYHTGDMILP